MKLNTTLKSLSFAFIIAAVISGCTPDEVKNGNPLTQSDPDATFTLTQVGASGNRYNAVGASESNILYHTWRYTSTDEDDSGESKGNATKDFFFPDAGTYTVIHRSVGKIGGINTLSEHTVTVTTPDPVAGNLLLDGKFTNGQGAWQILHISPSGAAWTFADRKANITVSGSNQQAIYQAVQVQAGVPYKLDMKVSGSGSTDTWFEVFVSPTAPSQNNDYSANGTRFALNTWAGCATSAFDGLISNVGCGDHSGNPITFATSGTVYVVIKSGGANSSINVDNVEFRRIN